jgi:WhiB family transcriptional regulator, redox-sensing transcriptional regulator
MTAKVHNPRVPPEWLALAIAVVGNSPPLDGAACRGRAELFDLQPRRAADRAHRESQALTLCAACQALSACQRWLDTLPAWQRPVGIVAGQVIRPAPGSQPAGRRRGRPPGHRPAG